MAERRNNRPKQRPEHKKERPARGTGSGRKKGRGEAPAVPKARAWEPGASRRKRDRAARKVHRFGWLYGVISGIIMVAAVLCACLIFFQVETVTVEGNTLYTTGEILETANIQQGKNLFFINRSAVSQRLTQGLPYVKTAEITRDLPGSVTIQVTECEAAAALVVSNGYWLIDKDGKLLELRTSDAGLVNVTGLNLDSPTIGTALTTDSSNRAKKNSLIGLLTALTDQELLSGVKSIDLSGGSQLVMQYGEKYTVRIPYGSDFAYKVRAMNGIIEELATEGDESSGIIDLTLENEWHFIPD